MHCKARRQATDRAHTKRRKILRISVLLFDFFSLFSFLNAIQTHVRMSVSCTVLYQIVQQHDLHFFVFFAFPARFPRT